MVNMKLFMVVEYSNIPIYTSSFFRNLAMA